MAAVTNTHPYQRRDYSTNIRDVINANEEKLFGISFEIMGTCEYLNISLCSRQNLVTGFSKTKNVYGSIILIRLLAEKNLHRKLSISSQRDISVHSN